MKPQRTSLTSQKCRKTPSAPKQSQVSTKDATSSSATINDIKKSLAQIRQSLTSDIAANSPLPNGINPADLFVSDPIVIILGQRLNDIKASLDDAHHALSGNVYSTAKVDKSIDVAQAHVKAAKDILPFLKSAIPEKIANLQKE